MRALFAALFLAAVSLVPSLGQAPAPVDAAAEAIRLNNLGVASMNQQKFEAALERFVAALAADASLQAARVNQAIALSALQRYDEARPLLDGVIKSDPDNARAWYTLGLMLRTLGESDMSLAAFERAAEIAPRDPYTHYFTGLLASQLQQQDKAVAAFQRALELDPFLVSAEFGLARAYQRTGRTDDAKRHMDRFSRLTQEKVASAMSLAYGDQGPLSLAQAVQPRGGAAPAAIPVKFVGPTMPPGAYADDSTTIRRGVCLLDADGDGAIDYLRLEAAAITLMRNDGKGRFTATGTLPGTDSPVMCAVGDFDNDEKPDIAVVTPSAVTLHRNEGAGTFAGAPIVVLKNGPATALASVTFVDFDHDADLDLLVTRGPGAKGLPAAAAVVLRNNGDGSFADVTADRGLGIPNTFSVTASDLNNDRAIDLVFVGERVTVAINAREGHFRTTDAFTPYAPANVRGVVAFDFDKDGWMDLAFTHFEAPVTVWRNVEGRTFEKIALPDVLFSGFGLTAIDFDNDGWIDLAASGYARPAGNGWELAILRNVAGRFEDVSAAVGVGALAWTSVPLALAAADLDGDNDADLLLHSRATGPVLIRNEGGNANNAVRIALIGLNDNRSGIGTKVEVQAGTIWQKFETVSASGFSAQGSPEILAGIGKAAQADVVRLLWPTGVVQDEVELKANTRHAITQIDRRGSSCPVLFSWNGERYEFIADAIGPAVIGHWVAPHTRNIPDVDEYVKVEGRHVAVKDGRLSFRFAEPMEEVIYLDQVKLFAVDHPAGTEVYPNEYFAALPPHPVAKTIASKGARLPVGAWDANGSDVMRELRDRDRTFVPIPVEGAASAAPGRSESARSREGAAERNDPPPSPTHVVDRDATARLTPRPPGGGFKGFAGLHSLELDLGDIPAGAPLRLLMHGFTDYFTANSVFAAHQAKVSAVLPWVEAQLPDGAWRRISDDIGFPAGLLRTMTADLTGRLPHGARRIRIWTNLKIYWDQILIDTTADGAVPVRKTEIPLAEASLAFRGFPREITGTPATDLQYVHGEVSKYGPYARHRGFYTKYGAVTPLLAEAEDRFVIFGAGDEVALEFDAAALPPLPEGWTRDYFVYFNGYVKDMDFYAAHAQTVAPLPFKRMPGYPYPDGAAYPDRLRNYLLEWNTREVAGEGWPTYRFDYGTRAR
jgi:tetratricopeptide (TPR) repeat protein